MLNTKAAQSALGSWIQIALVTCNGGTFAHPQLWSFCLVCGKNMPSPLIGVLYNAEIFTIFILNIYGIVMLCTDPPPTPLPSRNSSLF
jgi:hypothetical protein